METTLMDLVVRVGTPFRDNLWRTSTTDASVNTDLIDSGLKSGKDNKWVGSEVLFTNGTPIGSANPKTVVGFDADTGTLTLDSPYSTGGGVPAGTPYVMMRLRGSGVPFDYRLAALEHVIGSINDEAVEASLGLYDSASNLFTIPAGFHTVYRVWLDNADAKVYDIPFKSWGMRAGRKLWLKNRYDNSYVWNLNIEGSYAPEFSTSLTSVYNVHESAIDDAVEWITIMSQRPNEQAGGGRMFQERMRRSSSGDYRRPTERRVL